MGRRKAVNPKKNVTFRVDARLIAQYEILLRDPMAERGSYGKKSYIIEELLKSLLEATRQGVGMIDVSELTTLLKS